MLYGSVCSGIEAATLGFHPLGWKPQWFSEIEAFPSAVLEHHYPDVPNLGDMTKLHTSETFNGRPIELLVGGTPCQSFSVAGLRKGLADPRGNLALHFLKILDLKRPRWVVWENVAGVLSSWTTETDRPATADDYREARQPDPGLGRRGRVAVQTNDFDTFTSGLRELGYGVAYRVLDAQYFGVPQRRRRVFVVGHLGDWRPAAAVLFERQSLSGNPPPSRQKKQSPAADVAEGLGSRGVRSHTELDGHGAYVPEEVPEVSDTLRSGSQSKKAHGKVNGTDRVTLIPETANTLTRRMHKGINTTVDEGQTPIVELKDQSEVYDMRGNGDGDVVPSLTGDHINRPTDYTPMVFESRVARNGRGAPSEVVPPLKAQSGEDGRGDGAPLLAFQSSELRLQGKLSPMDISPTVKAETKKGDTELKILQQAQVRRLTPRECERLQGFPDDFTLVPHGRNAAKDFDEFLQYLRLTHKGLTEKEARKLAADGPRYKALGNSMAVPVMHWIGKRIQLVDNMLKAGRG